MYFPQCQRVFYRYHNIDRKERNGLSHNCDNDKYEIRMNFLCILTEGTFFGEFHFSEQNRFLLFRML